MVGTTLPDGTRIDAELECGTWTLFRGTSADGTGVLVTIAPQPPPEPSPAIVARELALPFPGIPRLRAIVDVEEPRCRALIEEAPAGTRISELPALALDDVITVARDLAELLAAIHAAQALHGDLRPQTTFVERVGGRLTLTGTTPRCTRFGVPLASKTRSGVYSPFFHDMFMPDVLLARDRAPSVAGDVAQLGMLIERMATGRSPFVDPDGNAVAALVRATTGDSAPWNLDAPHAQALEALAKAAFHPSSGPERELAPLRAFLEHAA